MSRRIIPIVAAPAELAQRDATQRQRLGWQMGFFILFALAPWFDLLRYDLNAGHAWLLTFEWHLGLDDFLAGRASAASAAANVLLRLFVPIVIGAAIFIGIAWRWGRLYCGWLCPHFSVVETINRVMIRASGKHSLWDRAISPWQPDGSPAPRDARWWLLVLPLAVLFAFIWAVVFLSYLLPPVEVYGNLLHGTTTRNQTIFLTAATLALSAEFLFARHLFCRYACAVGLFQSLAWMSNKRGMVVGFQRQRAAECATCLPDRQAACDAVCPMRLKPRTLKRNMFTCTQCGQCLQACASAQRDNPAGPLLGWIEGERAASDEAVFSAVKRDQPRERK